MTMYRPCDVVPCHAQSRGDISVLFMYDEEGGMLVVLINMTVMIHHFIRELHIMLVRDSCIRCKGTVWPDVSRHDLLHMRPSQARRLDNIRESSAPPS